MSRNDQRSSEARITQGAVAGKVRHSSRVRLRQVAGYKGRWRIAEKERAREGEKEARRRGGGRNSFRPRARAIEAGVMLGSHRERNPSRSENWHRRTTIYTPSALPPGPRARVRPCFPREFLGIPRLVTGGGDRVRFAISPTNTSAPNQTTPAERIHRRHRVEAQKLSRGW